jgi:hypothetical protein
VQKIEQAFGTAAGNPLMVTIPAGIALPGPSAANRAAILAGLGNSAVNVNLNLSGCTGITEWDTNIFISNTNKIAGLTLPDTVVTIKNNGLDGTNYPSLTSVSGPGVTTIEYQAFFNSLLTTGSFPALQTISSAQVFRSCYALSSLTLPASPPSLVSNPELFLYTGTGAGTGTTLNIHVGSAAAVSAYTSAWGVSATAAANSIIDKYGNGHKAVNIVE